MTKNFTPVARDAGFTRWHLMPLIACCFSCLVIGSAFAQSVPQLVNYQGMLTDAEGNPYETAEYTLVFSIFGEASGGEAVWGPQTFPDVPVVRGHFNVLLGPVDDAATALDAAFASPASYLEITVGGETIAPRQQILSAPYAVQAENAEKLGGVAHTNILDPAMNGTVQNASLFDGQTKAELFSLIAPDAESPHSMVLSERIEATFDPPSSESVLHTTSFHLSQRSHVVIQAYTGAIKFTSNLGDYYLRFRLLSQGDNELVSSIQFRSNSDGVHRGPSIGGMLSWGLDSGLYQVEFVQSGGAHTWKVHGLEITIMAFPLE